MRRPLRLLITLLPVYAQALPVFRPDVATSENEPLIQTAEIKASEINYKDLIKKIADERIDSATKPKPDIGGINVRFDGLEGQGGPAGVKMSDAYDVVAVINKAADVQKLTVYRFYTDKTTNERRALRPEEYQISSGRERWTTCSPNKKGDAMETRWMGTPTGFFNPYLVHADHHSGQYDDATMYHGVFFNKVGIATHAGKTNAARLSHGCVRMTDLGSSKVMQYVLQTGREPKLDSWAFRGECPSPEDLTDDQKLTCQAQAKEREGGYKLIAQAAVTEGKRLGMFYPNDPEIPNINQDGTAKAGEPAMRTNPYKALFVVQCIDKAGQDCSMTANTPGFKNKPDCSKAQAPEQVIARAAPTAAPQRPPPASDNPVGEFFSNIFGGGAPKPAPRQRTTGL